jgi:cell division septum initiation protein DivIVA
MTEPLRAPSALARLHNQIRGMSMKITTTLAVAVGLAALAACNKSPQENAAENITDTANNQAENITDTANNTAENITENAENKADAVKAAAENKADAVKNAADNSADKNTH